MSHGTPSGGVDPGHRSATYDREFGPALTSVRCYPNELAKHLPKMPGSAETEIPFDEGLRITLADMYA